MEAKTLVLVVEDEAAYVSALVSALSQEGFAMEVARTGPDAIKAFQRRTPDLVLLDVMLPGMSGIDVCRQIRAKSQVPIIMVTARTSEADTVVGLELGADDYITKPYRARELVARMRTVLRRSSTTQALASAPYDHDDKILIEGDIEMDTGRHSVSVAGVEVDLTVKEFALLEALMLNTGRALSRTQLVDLVWDGDAYGETKTVDVHIMRLRSKLTVTPQTPDYIKTIRGIGYRLEATASPSKITTAKSAGGEGHEPRNA